MCVSSFADSRGHGVQCALLADGGDADNLGMSRQQAATKSGLGSGEGSATLGRNSLVPWAVGIRPYKDVRLKQAHCKAVVFAEIWRRCEWHTSLTCCRRPPTGDLHWTAEVGWD